MNVSVRSKLVAGCSLHKESPTYKRLDVLPFAFLYMLALHLAIDPSSSSLGLVLPINESLLATDVCIDGSSGSDSCDANLSTQPDTAVNATANAEWMVSPHRIPGLVALAIVAALHVLSYAWCYWSVHVRTRLRFYNTQSLSIATHILITPAPHCGSTALCELVHNNQDGKVRFDFQKITFCLVDSQEQDDPTSDFVFVHLDFPVDNLLSQYLLSTGLGSMQEEIGAVSKWGVNEFAIPSPQLKDVFKAQVMSPFFLFQMLCVALWMLDEYWYYALLSGVMLVVLALATCVQRMMDLNGLRNMRKEAYPIWVFREFQWQCISTDKLLPNDICSLVKAAKPGPHDAIKSNTSPHKSLAPCDIVLLYGSCIVNEAMLTGESVPKTKSSLASLLVSQGVESQLDVHLSVQDNQDGTSVDHIGMLVLGGTSIVDHVGEKHPTALVREIAKLEGVRASPKISPPPDGGAVGYVVRTGYYTSQGNLMRTILFSTERVGEDSAETYVFLFCLLLLALLASGYVLTQKWHEQVDSDARWKLVLHCIMIITAVVPPDLPIQLSLAVTNSLSRLVTLRIYCTEPYRIPLAGKLDVCCFDKTGTLTSDKLIVSGVSLLSEGTAAGHINEQEVDDEEEEEGSISGEKHSSDIPLTSPTNLSLVTQAILASCHELVRIDGKVQGGPMELASLESVHWKMISDGSFMPIEIMRGVSPTNIGAMVASQPRVMKLAVHPFSSTLRRMSCVVQAHNLLGKGSRNMLVMCKGAPEVIRELLSEVPHDFDHATSSLMRSGFRVLAMAIKELPAGVTRDNLHTIPRDQVECGLTFAGLLVLDSPMKEDTRESIAQLQQSGHRIVIITGDNPLTACNVAKELNITGKDESRTLLLDVCDDDDDEEQQEQVRSDDPASLNDRLSWMPLSEHSFMQGEDVDDEIESEHPPIHEFDLIHMGDFESNGISLVIRGDAISLAQRMLTSEAFQSWMKTVCPHVTVFARVAPFHKGLVLASLKATGLVCMMCGDGTNDVGALKQADVGVSIINNPDMERVHKNAKSVVERVAPGGVIRDRSNNNKEKQLTLAQSFQLELRAMEEAEGGSTVAQLGDASIASPFTSQTPTIASTVHVIRQGRCTLVTTIQIFKVLALNCVISAYSLSALYLHGVKQGDTQMTIAAVVVSGLFLCITGAKPVDTLAPQRPVSNLFSRQVLISLFGQMVVHITSLLAVLRLCQPHVVPDSEEMAPDADFKPNVINTAVFYIGLCMHTNVFACNYQGLPFMQSIKDFKALNRILLGSYVLMFVLALEMLPELDEYLELVPAPSDSFRYELAGYMVANSVFAMGWETAVRKLFA